MQTNGSRAGTVLLHGRRLAALVLVTSMLTVGCGGGGAASDGGPATSEPGATNTVTAADDVGTGSNDDLTPDQKIDWCGLLTADEVAGYLGRSVPPEGSSLGCRWKTGDQFGARGDVDSVLGVSADGGWDSYVDDGFTPVAGIGVDALEFGDEAQYVLLLKLASDLVRVRSFNLDPERTRDAARLVVTRI